MANQDKLDNRSVKRIQKLASGIQGNMDHLYKSTYYSTPQMKNSLKTIGQQINSTLDRITNNNMDTIGMPNISKLYSRLDGSSRVKSNSFIDNVEKMFEDSALMDDLYSSFMDNKFLKDLDQEIDTVCKYMPKLKEALDTKKDNVLSADHFSKDFLSVNLPSVAIDKVTFEEHVKDIKRKYNLNEIIEEIYDTASMYGEQFVYIIPYKKAFQKLLANKDGINLSAMEKLGEATVIGPNSTYANFSLKGGALTITESCNGGISNTSRVVSETATFQNKKVSSAANGSKKVVIEDSPIIGENNQLNIVVEINQSGIIDSLVNNRTIATAKAKTLTENSVWLTEDTDIKAGGNFSFDAVDDDNSRKINDGLINPNNFKEPEDVKISVPGCILKLIPDRSQVIPIYIDDICMGYYYIEFKTADMSSELMGFKNILGDPLTNMKSNGNAFDANTIESGRHEDLIRYLSGQLSEFIDQKFINNNQDLRKELYMILKYNDIFNGKSVDKIKVTFIHPEDMVHVHFRQDSITHRGISDLDRSLIPAKLYSSLYVTNTIGILTRGQDKRVYYVKQTVESNIAKTLLNVIQQIKQSNFNIRQFQNINSVLNITGRFNDYVIPTSASGDAPVQFEVMPGQNIDVKTELMNILEEMAVNQTDVSLDIIQSRMSVDFATQLSMSNSKFLRKVYARQAKYQPFISRIISKIYSTEYGVNVDLEATLPPPMFLNITNTNQMINNTKEYVQSIVDKDLAAEQDDTLKAIYTKNLLDYHLGTQLDISANERILARSKMEAKTKSIPEENQ